MTIDQLAASAVGMLVGCNNSAAGSKSPHTRAHAEIQFKTRALLIPFLRAFFLYIARGVLVHGSMSDLGVFFVFMLAISDTYLISDSEFFCI